jgi:hypothetical protein
MIPAAVSDTVRELAAALPSRVEAYSYGAPRP